MLPLGRPSPKLLAPIGPLARVLVQAAVIGISVLARALPAAYGQALVNARKGGLDEAAGVKGSPGEGILAGKKMANDEALQVLNIGSVGQKSGGEIDPVLVKRQYEKYFNANSVDNGGSFYVQSKIFRAKEQLDVYLKEKGLEGEEEKSNKKV